jgi:hypothetical protein
MQVNDDDVKEQVDRLNNEIKNLELAKSDLHMADLDVQKALDFALLFVQSLPLKWKKLDPADLRVLRGLLFPKNISYSYPGFKTADLAPIYRMNQESNGEKDDLVAPRGIEPRFTP